MLDPIRMILETSQNAPRYWSSTRKIMKNENLVGSKLIKNKEASTNNKNENYCYAKLIQHICTNATVSVKMHEDSSNFRKESCVRQEDTISQKLFSSVLEYAFMVSWQHRGILVDGENLNRLRSGHLARYALNQTIEDPKQVVKTTNKINGWHQKSRNNWKLVGQDRVKTVGERLYTVVDVEPSAFKLSGMNTKSDLLYCPRNCFSLRSTPSIISSQEKVKLISKYHILQ